MIVVLDSSVVISAVQFARARSKPFLACEKARNIDIIASCNEIEAEMRGVLIDTFHLAGDASAPGSRLTYG